MLIEGRRAGIRYFFDEALHDQGFLVAFSTKDEVIPGVDADKVTFANQVHGVNTVFVDSQSGGAGSDPSRPPIPDADALITDVVGLPLAVRTADCVPVLLVDPVAKVVGAIHAGWRGTIDRIAGCAVEAMASAGANPSQIQARFGPSIGPCCYEVDQTLYMRFAAAFEIPPAVTRPTLDLRACNRLILVDSGVPGDNIESLDLCTACDNKLFYSWRAARDVGRLVSIVSIL